MSADEALAAMRAGWVPARVLVTGNLALGQVRLVGAEAIPMEPPRALPDEHLLARAITIYDASHLTSFTRLVRCRSLDLRHFAGDFEADSVIEFTAVAGDREWGEGALTLWDCPNVTRLPDIHGALCDLHIVGCPRLEALPDELRVNTLRVRGSPAIHRMPRVIETRELDLVGLTDVRTLPDRLVVSEVATITGCTNLTRLSGQFGGVTLNLEGCRALTTLPTDLRALYINLNGCASLARWDDPSIVELRQLSARGCVALESLPPNLRQIDELDVSGCARLTRLPDGLRVTRWIDVGESGVRALPAAAWGAQVRWNGVNVTGQIAFHPETLSVRQALAEENVEVRRIMLERIGPEQFVREASPTTLDADTDAGGARRLLRVDIEDEEAYVALEVHDPSTGRMYLLRVPPHMDSCRRAAAWIAGFDDPVNYLPVIEA